MRHFLILAVILLSASFGRHACAQETLSPPHPCDMARSEALEMAFEEFDSGEAGWRRWADNGCEREGAGLIVEYRNRHSDQLDPSQIDVLDWHAGQLFAGAGDYGFAIERMLLVQENAAEPVEAEYVAATIAFLRSDREALLTARERMMAIPEPAGFSRAADRYVATYDLPRPVWPMNIDIVDGLIACFGWSYKKAYQCELPPDE